jgi:DNA-binding transcriptional LysR family regulator
MQQMIRLTVFAAVVEEQGFSAAATRLELSNASVSKQIHTLEEELGVRLLNRSTRRLELTAAGQNLYTECAPLLKHYLRARDRAHSLNAEPQGTLRISAPQGYGQYRISPLLPRFLAQHPQLSVRLQLEQHRLQDLDWQMDVALMFGKLEDSNLVAKKLGESHNVVCASPEYLAQRGAPQFPKELMDHNCLLMEYPNIPDTALWEFRRSGRRERIRVGGNFITNDSTALLTALLDGGGISSLPSYLVTDALKRGELVSVLSEYAIAKVPLYAVYHHRKFRPTKLTAFLDFLEQELPLL